MHTFYLESPAAVGERSLLPQEEAKHALRVLRLSVGEQVCVLDRQGGRFVALLERADSDMAEVRLIEALPSNESGVRVTLYQGLPKSDKLDWVVQKLTELGVDGVVPVKMERCVVKSDEKDGRKRKERLERIAREAVKQCHRACAPVIEPPLTWKQAMERMKGHDLVLVPWEETGGLTMKGVHREQPGVKNIGIVIGPEGGMSAQEVGTLASMGARAVTLGPRILRTETAAIAAVTMAMTLWGDL
ncbi:MAG: 16S rRNA (uracil(1498)-N(3))-methyltransferase [Christensenellales bacterium]|nr:16S rRNA (uracil(1498)-N(3))-methyltransferase [Christensenellales bacterium]